MCRTMLTRQLVYTISRDQQHSMVGNYGTKINTLVTRLKTDVPPGSKCLVFSQWPTLLAVVEHALVANAIACRRLAGSAQAKSNALRQFKESTTMNVILIPVRSGASGLTLVQAQYAFLMEPNLNPSLEEQAMNRLHRIGQTKKTYVFKFVVQNTIEERILQVQAKRCDQSLEHQWKYDEFVDMETLDFLLH